VTFPVGTPFKVKLSPAATVAEMPVPTTVTVIVAPLELAARTDATLLVAPLNVPTIVALLVPADGDEGDEIVAEEPQPIDNVAKRTEATPAPGR
jgi:hypothetical protein